MSRPLEPDIAQYRALLETPSEFKDGFGWTTVAGLVFCGLVMMPGAIYLGLMTGGNFGSAAAWVTTILFMEMARRAMRPMARQQLVVLLHAAHVMMVGNMLFPGGPLAQLVYRGYLVGSEAVRDAGMLGAFPKWFAPSPDSPAVVERALWHPDWWAPIGLLALVFLLGLINKYTLGYIFFRLTSDIEQLPFPRAPINAQGAMALAEAEESSEVPGDLYTPGASRKPKAGSERWRVFALGVSVGLVFGAVQIGIPAISGLFLSKPFFLLPQPFLDTTTLTETFLPATPTGIALDLGLLLLGMVLPFWAIIGTGLAVVLTLLLNPLLYTTGVLQTWQPGMDTVNTTFSNNLDFWLSFNIGAGFGLAVISVVAAVREFLRRSREARRKRAEPATARRWWEPPRAGRGDYPLWVAGAIYFVSAAVTVAVSLALLPLSPGVVGFILFFAFIYNPFISYVSARLIGISGQQVDIPYIKEMGFLLSGARGIEIWLAPVPVENYGEQAQSFRVNELTGVTFWSLIKTDLVALPILLTLSLFFWGFIWHSDPIPSELFPAAQVNWELASKNQVLIYSSTFVPPSRTAGETEVRESEFMKAIHSPIIGAGFFGVVGLFGLLSWFGLPIMLVYGMMRGFGQFPHLALLEVTGALLGRYYFRKRVGEKRLLQLAPVIFAGYLTGVGLIGMATIATQLIQTAVSGAPF